MMQGYYLFFGTNSSGVLKKIEMQKKEFCKHCTFEVINVVLKPRNILKKIFSRFIFSPIGYDYSLAFSQISPPDFLYIRRPKADIGFISFLKKIKDAYPHCKIIVEVFTFPYDLDEFGGDFKRRIVQLPWKIKDKHYRKKLKLYVDRFVTYSDDDSIFGVKTIKTSNGTNVEDILPRIPDGRLNKNEINLLSVANMQRHHGYERLINGLADYYRSNPQRKVYLHMVGDGQVVSNYKELVSRNNLNEFVLFYGKRTGPDLDNLYNKADIAVASFGMYKLGIETISTLKTCEYLAKGLPIISGSKISGVAGNEYFIKYFDNNSSNVDIGEVVDFYDEVYQNGVEQVASDEVNFCREHFNMDVVLKPVLDYINGRINEKNN